MQFITYLSDYPQYAGAILIVLMFLESLPVTGFFIPGIFILPLLGAVTASSDNSFWYLYICVACGALLGDVSGFWLGRLEAHKWQPNILNRYRQNTVQHSYAFIKKHGLLALFLGRFVWLIHPAIPGAAGLLKVKFNHFILIDTPAILLWALFYMGGGHLLTGLWFSHLAKWL
ncbi:hypothetical protein MNBD_GAMMA09-3654 [hydrothermal vent metagenome]|uniref:VTT domain-containing protein n=1 Tax=hydrothermal vent metagenome TaxID=652676 RepID=A0A3B0X0Q9_9ZZZZ